MMKVLLTAINAKYIHSNLAVYSLKAYAEENLIKIDAKNIVAPSWLKGKIAKAEFNRLAKLLLEIEVVNELDITSLAVYCENYESQW